MRFGYILAFAAAAWAASPSGQISLQFFISSDCPISNSYTPEIQRLCGEYASKGVNCSLVYEDVGLTGASLQKHLAEYGYAGMPAIKSVVIDATRKLANRAHATVTPEAVVFDSHGDIRYRGRIDNFYAALGKPRQQVTARDLRDALDAVLGGRAVPNPETKALGCYIVPADILSK